MSVKQRTQDFTALWSLSIIVTFRCKPCISKMSAFEEVGKMTLFTSWRRDIFENSWCFCEGFINPGGRWTFPGHAGHVMLQFIPIGVKRFASGSGDMWERGICKKQLGIVRPKYLPCDTVKQYMKQYLVKQGVVMRATKKLYKVNSEYSINVKQSKGKVETKVGI